MTVTVTVTVMTVIVTVTVTKQIKYCKLSRREAFYFSDVIMTP